MNHKLVEFILSVGFEYKSIHSSEFLDGYLFHINNACYLIEIYKNENIIMLNFYGVHLMRTGGVDWFNVTEEDIDNIIKYIKSLNGIKQIVRKYKLQNLLN